MSRTEKKKAESSGRIALQVLLTGLAYYVATEIAWALCFPNSKVSLLFPPHAVLVVILLLVPVRHWWAYVLATVFGSLRRHAAGAMAGALRFTLRGFRCRAKRVGRGRDSRSSSSRL